MTPTSRPGRHTPAGAAVPRVGRHGRARTAGTAREVGPAPRPARRPIGRPRRTAPRCPAAPPGFPELPRKEVAPRMKEISAGQRAGESAQKAIRDMQAAMTAVALVTMQSRPAHTASAHRAATACTRGTETAPRQARPCGASRPSNTRGQTTSYVIWPLPGAAFGIRTRDLRITSALLWPSELRRRAAHHGAISNAGKSTQFPEVLRTSPGGGPEWPPPGGRTGYEQRLPSVGGVPSSR